MYAAYPLGPLARYSPYLLLKYHCHLNVEVYKYYFKYLYKHAARGPAMWVAFCKLRRSLKPALKHRRVISAQLAHAAPIGCVQVLLARTRPCQTCPPAAARPGTSVGSAARRRRLPASRASAALRVSCTSRGRQVRRQVGALALGLHTLSTTPSLRLQAREVPRDRLQSVLPAQCEACKQSTHTARFHQPWNEVG